MILHPREFLSRYQSRSTNMIPLPEIFEVSAFECMSAEEVLRRLEAGSEITPATSNMLAQRPEPLVRLAVAKYSRWKDTLKGLCEDSDERVRLTAWGNPYRFDDGIDALRPHCEKWERILSAPISGEYLAIICNPSFFQGELEDLFKRRGLFKSLTDTDWENVCSHCLLANPTFTKKETLFDDYWSRLARKGVVHLLENGPVEHNWAVVLNAFLKKASLGCYCVNVADIIHRWQSFPWFVGTIAYRATLWGWWYRSEANADDSNENELALAQNELREVREGFYQGIRVQNIAQLESYYQKDGGLCLSGLVKNASLLVRRDLMEWMDSAVAKHECSNSDDGFYDHSYWRSIKKNAIEQMEKEERASQQKVEAERREREIQEMIRKVDDIQSSVRELSGSFLTMERNLQSRMEIVIAAISRIEKNLPAEIESFLKQNWIEGALLIRTAFFKSFRSFVNNVYILLFIVLALLLVLTVGRYL